MSLIKKYEEKMNVVSEELSAKLELKGISIHKQSLYDIECNKRTVKDYELFGIASILKVDVNDLFVDMKKSFGK